VIYREARVTGRDSPLNEAAAHLYLLMGTFVLDGRFVSEPVRLQDLVAIMHCEPITVRRARKRLTDLGELRFVDGGQGKAAVRFELVKMAGPLYAEKGGAAVASGAPTSIPESEVTLIPESEATTETGSSLRSQSPKFAATSIPESEVAAADPFMYLEEEGDQSSTSKSTAVDQFCAWWPDAYEAHNGGVLNRVRPSDRDAAEVLTIGTGRGPGRTLDHLQAMAIELWSLRGNYSRSDRSFIETSDHSICILLQKATIIEREVVRRGLAVDAARRLETDQHQQHREYMRDRQAQEIAEQAALEAIDLLTPAARATLDARAQEDLKEFLCREPSPEKRTDWVRRQVLRYLEVRATRQEFGVECISSSKERREAAG
jgi:hypothetical protein